MKIHMQTLENKKREGEMMSSLYSVARENYLKWVAVGKPLQSPLHDDMESSRKIFKAFLRACKLNEQIEICKSITEQKFLQL